jgi:hypothetical protein
MTARVDQLALELAKQAEAGVAGSREAYLLALRGVLANAAAKLTAASLPMVGDTLRSLALSPPQDEALQVRARGAGYSADWHNLT